MNTSFDRITLPAGSLLFSEGDAGPYAYLIERGRIEVFVTRGGRHLRLATRGPGEIVGEMAIIDCGTRSASAQVVEDCELALITDEQVARRIDAMDPIMQMCLGVVIDRYRETVALIDQGNIKTEVDTSLAPPSRQFQSALTTLSLENELRRALAQSELELYFQPIVRLPTRKLAGFETLLRWNHPERGIILPGVFIPIAEASGLIVEMTGWCIAEIGRQFPKILAAATESDAAGEPLFMSINISGHDLGHSSFVSALATMLRTTGLVPGSIKLEVTESVLMKEPRKAAAVLSECRRLGLTIAIDDFGTGYSSLSHLSTLPITTIKIDQSFVRSMIEDSKSRKIIHMILRLAGELEIPVVAEGIEGEQEAIELGSLGCALGQGYLFGRPQPLARTLDITRNWQPFDRPQPEPLPIALCA